MNEGLELLLRQAHAGDRQAVEQIFEENTALVWSVVKRFFGRGLEADDLFQLGSIGLLKAIDGYDESFGTRFSTYAVPKIAGEIRRFLRDDGAIKVSRTLKERSSAIKIARQQMTGELDREPTLSELAARLGLTQEEIACAETATAAAQSIQRESGEEGFTLEAVLTDGDMEDSILESVALRDAIRRLPERERQVICLRFFHGLTQEKTAGLLHVSQVQISRLERKALERLRTLL